VPEKTKVAPETVPDTLVFPPTSHLSLRDG
jgi:hypothetical protein